MVFLAYVELVSRLVNTSKYVSIIPRSTSAARNLFQNDTKFKPFIIYVFIPICAIVYDKKNNIISSGHGRGMGISF